MESILNEVTPKFQENSWQFIKQNNNLCQFSKNTKEFQISVLKHEIEVQVPLKECDSNYKTNFDDYFSATEYLMRHLNYQENICD